MDVIGFNKQIRSIVSKWVEEGELKGIDRKKTIDLKIPYIYTLFEKDAYSKLGVCMLLCTGYLDAYKILSYKQKECMNNDEEEDILGLLCDIEDYDDLVAEISADPNLLARLLEKIDEFANMNGLAKMLLVKSLSDSENAWLNSRFCNHQEDIINYDKEVTVSLLTTNYKRKKHYQENVSMIDFNDGIIMNLVGFINNLVKIDMDNATSLALEIGKIDYAASKYLVGKFSDEDDIFLDHIDYYESYPVDAIVNRLLFSPEFLKDAIWMVLAIMVNKNYRDIPLSEDLLANKDAKKMAKKLVLK